MGTHQIRTYEPFADFFRGGPLQDLVPMFDMPRVRSALATMPAAPTIRMDVKETPAAYLVTAAIPGVRKEDIHVTVEGGTVGITATVERRDEKREGETVLCTELYAGEVARTFTLPADVDEAKAEAKYEDGMLELKLPKQAGARARKLTVA
ncbi:MAG: Hsp20/alpha crystallin family protein [Burkholderiales bacterium]